MLWIVFSPPRFGCQPFDMVKGVNNWVETAFTDERGDVPGWVLITLMTAGPDFTL